MRALLDAQQHVVRLVHRGLGKVHVVGADDRQALVIGEIDQRPLDAPLVVLAVALQLEIEPAVEQLLQAIELMLRRRRLPAAQQPAEHAAGLPVKASRPSVWPSSSSSGSAAVEPILKSRWARLTSRIRLR